MPDLLLRDRSGFGSNETIIREDPEEQRGTGPQRQDVEISGGGPVLSPRPPVQYNVPG